MKSDKQKLLDLLTEFGVPVSLENDFFDTELEGCSSVLVGEEWEPRVAKDSKITGYTGFWTQFDFDKDEKFVQIGAWE